MSGDAYPISLDLTDRLVVVVGGGPVAARKATAVLEAGGRVHIVSPELGEAARLLLDDPRVTWAAEHYRAGTVEGCTERVWLVHTASGDPATDAAVADEADRAGVWCVRADDAAASRAWNPAVTRGAAGGPAEGVVVAVTGGGDPRRAVALRNAISAELESGVLPVRRVRHEAVLPSAPPRAEQVGRAHVALVGGGPGDPGLLTVRGRELLDAADVVIADRLGPTSVLEGLDAQIIDVGKQRDRHPVPQGEINALIVEHARRGRRVVRLKGGDPFVLGRGGEEVLHCAEHGIPVEVVPGITSAVSVPAAAGIPVTHRGITTSFVVASAHDGATGALDGLRDAPPEATLVLLMGVSSLRSTAESLVAAGRDPGTPVALVESGWTPQQRVTRTYLADAARAAEEAGVRAPAVIVIGEVVRVADEVALRLAGHDALHPL